MTAKNNFKILTGKSTDHLLEFENSGIFLHKDVILPFKELRSRLQDEVNVDLAIISGFRSYERQLKIWNEKALGKRPLLDKMNNPIDITNLGPKEIVDAILNWSAIPGCSRHHWGTDIDIYDAAKLSKDKVQLVSSECDPGGAFEILHTWIDNNINSTDFFRPYTTDHGGVGIEKWHLSYCPIAQKFFEDFNLDFYIQHIEDSEILYKDVLLSNPTFYFEKYFRTIDLPLS